MSNHREEEWWPVYLNGVKAYLDGKSEDNNPYGRGQLMNRCAWAGGWHDKRRENTNEQLRT